MNLNQWLFGNRSLTERKYKDLSMIILSLNQNNIFGIVMMPLIRPSCAALALHTHTHTLP